MTHPLWSGCEYPDPAGIDIDIEVYPNWTKHELKACAKGGMGLVPVKPMEVLP